MAKQITTEKKKIQGTYEMGKQPTMKDVSLTGIPDPSERLDIKAYPYYYCICKVLQDSGRLAEPYLLTIERYAMYTYRFWECERLSRDDMGAYKAGTGHTSKNAYQQIMTDLEKNFQWFEVKFGLNPLDQDKVPRLEKEEDDPLFR